jgi:hypothetical protein
VIKDFYAVVMDPEQNPLRSLPRMVRFQYMLILSYIWSAVFTIWVGAPIVLGPSVLGHIAALIAVFFTADLFRRARARAVSHRDEMRDPSDGTVLYDDVWGAPFEPAVQSAPLPLRRRG